MLLRLSICGTNCSEVSLVSLSWSHRNLGDSTGGGHHENCWPINEMTLFCEPTGWVWNVAPYPSHALSIFLPPWSVSLLTVSTYYRKKIWGFSDPRSREHWVRIALYDRPLDSSISFSVQTSLKTSFRLCQIFLSEEGRKSCEIYDYHGTLEFSPMYLQSIRIVLRFFSIEDTAVTECKD